MTTLPLLMMAASLAAESPDGPPSKDSIRAAIKQSVPYIEKRGLWWMEKKKCVSCHRVGTMLWSLSAARQQGISVSDQLDTWFQWAVSKSLSKNDQGKTMGGGNRTGLTQLFMVQSPAERTDRFILIENDAGIIDRQPRQIIDGARPARVNKYEPGVRHHIAGETGS